MNGRRDQYRRIYLASSWRNAFYPAMVTFLRDSGHEVYDFRAPAPGLTGFHWSEIDRDWQRWRAPEFLEALGHPLARRGFDLDLEGMKWADTFVLLMPCGRSAHLELGWAIGRGLPTAIVLPEGAVEPELMYGLADRLFWDPSALLDWLQRLSIVPVPV